VPFKHHAEHRHHIPRPRYRVTNRSEYDAALRRRGSLTAWFTDEAIAAWRAEPRTTPGGQPHYSALAITTALTMRAVFSLALRQTEGLIGSIIELLGLALAVPDHSTLSRRSKRLEMPLLRRSGTGPLHLLVDSTGLKLGGAGEWRVEKHGTSRRRSWRKLHLGVDAESGAILAIELTSKEIDDAARSGVLLDQTSIPSRRSQLTAPTIRTAFTRRSPSVIRTPPSSCRHVQQQSRALPPKLLRHSGTDISRRSPNAVGWIGKRRVATIFGPRWGPQLVDTNA
jgi:Transposase DDE domain